MIKRPFVWLTMLSAVGTAWAEDAVIVAAKAALERGQPVAAIELVKEQASIPGYAPEHVVYAQALLATGQSEAVIAALRLKTSADLNAWPSGLRSQVAAVYGEASALRGQVDQAVMWLKVALRAGGAANKDRLLVLLAEVLASSGAHAEAQRYAHIVWRDWPRSPYRARAGLLEARLVAERQPEVARAILTGIRVIDHQDPEVHLAATEELCALLVKAKPLDCIRVVDECSGEPTFAQSLLPMWRALAVSKIDPNAGEQALSKLPAKLQSHPAVLAARERLADKRHEQENVEQQCIARAEVALAAGRISDALNEIRELAKTNMQALRVLSQIPNVPLKDYVNSPAAQEAVTKRMLAIALARSGDFKNAYPILNNIVKNPNFPAFSQAEQAACLFWAAEAATAIAADEVDELRSRLLALQTNGVEVGMAWSREAQRRELAHAANKEIQHAWLRAAQALPSTHGWFAMASWRAARSLVASEDKTELMRARDLLMPAATSGDTEDHRRCRFYLAQVYERLKKPQEALQLVKSLEAGASPEQRARLQRLALRLQSAISASTQVQSDPLDAQN